MMNLTLKKTTKPFNMDQIEGILKELEEAIGDPDKGLVIGKCLSHLKAALSESPFYITGVGNSNDYSMLRGHTDEQEHRFLIGGFKSMMDSLIESRLPDKVKKANSKSANKLWALTYLHSILENAGLGNPFTHKARRFIAKDNDLLKDSVIFLDEYHSIIFKDHGHTFTVNGSSFRIEYRNSDLGPLFDDIIKDTTQKIRDTDRALDSIRSVDLLPNIERRKNLAMLRDINGFYALLRAWAQQEKDKLKEKDD